MCGTVHVLIYLSLQFYFSISVLPCLILMQVTQRILTLHKATRCSKVLQQIPVQFMKIINYYM